VKLFVLISILTAGWLCEKRFIREVHLSSLKNLTLLLQTTLAGLLKVLRQYTVYDELCLIYSINWFHYWLIFCSYILENEPDSRLLSAPVSLCLGFMERPDDFADTLFIARITQWEENQSMPKGYCIFSFTCFNWSIRRTVVFLVVSYVPQFIVQAVVLVKTSVQFERRCSNRNISLFHAVL
jgi:Dis3-like cold-shock domain 2 (CSD2)